MAMICGRYQSRRACLRWPDVIGQRCGCRTLAVHEMTSSPGMRTLGPHVTSSVRRYQSVQTLVWLNHSVSHSDLPSISENRPHHLWL